MPYLCPKTSKIGHVLVRVFRLHDSNQIATPHGFFKMFPWNLQNKVINKPQKLLKMGAPYSSVQSSDSADRPDV